MLARHRWGVAAVALVVGVVVTVAPAVAASGPQSSSLTSGTLNTKIWTVLNPDGKLSMQGPPGWLTLPTETAPTASFQGKVHNIVVQPVSASANWTVSVQVTFYGQNLGTATSPVLPHFQGGSIIAWQNYSNWMRVLDQPSTCQIALQWLTNGQQGQGAGTATVNSTSLAAVACNSQGYPLWLRLSKNGTTYNGYYSLNGSTWTVVGTETDTLQVADVGLYAGQGGGTSPPTDMGFRDFTVGSGPVPGAGTAAASSSTTTSSTSSSASSTTSTSNASSSTATASSSTTSSSSSSGSVPKTGEGPMLPLAGLALLLSGFGLARRRRRAQG